MHRRLCLVLWQRYQQKEGGIMINKQQLSEQLAVAPRSINRILSGLRDDNIITIISEQSQVINPQLLCKQAGH
ncbi:helix-turn-helix domain-containing protein [Klebsiella aerogenes]|uniref:helix-turn-helix domain-containing protein n=1 Tax=Klebsiella aerogenes TaxID=548 RepID=UPI00094964F0|nr:helix-turn-helix domain-containing protein [Klebsiella aerogenes]